MNEPTSVDFLVIGAGIAGASLAYWLAPHGRVIVLERESQPGYHSTGRSAALFMESYGTPQVRALTMASRAFLEHPPAGFAETSLVSPRGALWVADVGQEALLEAQWTVLREVSARARRLDRREACTHVPVLRPERVVGGVLEPDAADMDVHALHQGFLRGLRQHAGRVVTDAEVLSMSHHHGLWRIDTQTGQFRAPIVVNAAGAWADEIAQLAGAAPIGLEPRRRSAFIFPAPVGVDIASWPLCIGADETWYLKPDAGMLLGSPANADPVAPHDVQPEELDIAFGIHQIERMTTLRIVRPTRSWAGLRSFAPDGDLVGGFDAARPGFFWLAGQGGYGIQTAPAMGQACAALILGAEWPAHVAQRGLVEAMLSPRRLQARGRRD